MSRFFRPADDSDSESEESDEELMSSGDDEPKPTAAAKPLSRFLRTADADSSSSSSDSDDDDEDSDSEGDAKGDSGDESDSGKQTIVIRSAAQKRLDEMEATGKIMENGQKINDWVAISNGVFVSFK